MLPDLGSYVAPGEAPPFSDQTLVDVRAGRATVLTVDHGVAVVRDGELEMVVAQEARGRGIGTNLMSQALALGGGAAPRLAWAHGDHPAARALADRFGWRAVRTLLQLRAPVADSDVDVAADADADVALPDGYSLSAFRPGTDDETDWLALNAAAFAHHPEQGRMTLDDLHAREADDWFSGEDLLLLRDASGQLAGSCWLKVEDGIGEFYAVAVRPDLQGQRLGGVLMRAGTARLRGRGLTAAALYVEGDNEPALALYRRSGFTQHAIDVQYAAPSPSGR
ncbi:mycothiol synthase [Curtobacterium flaccumfaciens]|uniref:mycothiol synthase n=1 Tax=Curtobacterium flaccumfaciens TaxID=2035 RepID=UPI000FFF04DC|nr:mycothiol synthase [Curtobacterium flaccumfaciens]MCS0647445.1 mycothiol synthase [Curtobacterium flaccumfaciens pv. flaccumfaciens]MCS6525040.1 mycothiol synthase [Curtobacterium flaccumfaciens pv. flaccumfaciens]MCS6530186.1 mycothiol synthase [Curtobacterium flaccumfaciens pv. flaccumfaciens]NUU10132.1 mycothiol synthase [Curtobacterium flaccumfaciens]RXF85074.1 mycothiol synthase [Curtobacterium flaccumfaciens pv. flaccumfaciens]